MMKAKSFQPYSKWKEQQSKVVLDRETEQNLYERLSGIQVESAGG